MTASIGDGPGPEAGTIDLSALVRAAAGGDVDAFAALYDDTSRAVFGMVVRIVGDPHDAEEVTLDVYTQVWRQASRFDPARGSVLGWIFRIAQSRAIDRVRSRGTGRSFVDVAVLESRPDPGRDPERDSISAQRASRVEAALSSLSVDQRTAIELAFFEGLTHVEIADRLGLPLGTTKSRIRLGMTRLRGALRLDAAEAT